MKSYLEPSCRPISQRTAASPPPARAASCLPASRSPQSANERGGTSSFRRTVDGFVAQLKNPKKPSINRTIVDLVAADVLRFASRTQEVSA